MAESRDITTLLLDRSAIFLLHRLILLVITSNSERINSLIYGIFIINNVLVHNIGQNNMKREFRLLVNT